MAIRDTSAQDVPLPIDKARRASAVAWLIGGTALATTLVGGVLAIRAHGASFQAAGLTIATVERGRFVRDVASEGKVIAATSEILYAKTSGIASAKVTAGERVRPGQLLVQIESPELRSKMEQERSNAEALRSDYLRARSDARQQSAQAESALAAAEIELSTARNDLERQQKAFDAGAIPGIQVARAQDALKKAQIARDQASLTFRVKEESLKLDVRSRELAWKRQALAVDDLRRQIDELKVRAPVVGQVGQLFVPERGSVTPDTKLLSVVDLSAFEVQVQIAESMSRDLVPGMPAEVSVGGIPWKAKVRAISPEVVNNEVEARLRFVDSAPSQIRQNQRVHVRFVLEDRDRVTYLQRGSFIDEGGGNFAYVLRDDVARRVPVRIGARGIDKVEILEGLRPGDRVVISGSESFKGASEVRVRD